MLVVWQVGILVVVSLVLKSRPSVLLTLGPHFLENASRYGSSGRLPFQLWVVNQASRLITFSQICNKLGWDVLLK